MKIKILVIAAVLSAGIGCKYKPATVTPPPPPAPAVTQPAVAPEDQPPSPNSLTDLVITPTPKAAVAVPAPLLPNQYPNQPPRVGQVVQYCKSVCTINWSGSMFGGPRNPANICMVVGNTADGAATIVAHINATHPDGIRMDTQLAPDGSRCIYEAPQCTVSNGCLTAAEKKLCPSCR